MSAPLKTFYLLVLTIALSLFMVGHNNNPTISPSPTLNSPIVLYDGMLGTLPGAQGFVYPPPPIPGSSVQSISNGVTTLDTTLDINNQAGYSTLPPLKPGPVLDRAKGYTIRFTSQVITETHTSNNRAGFSVIALSSDLRGIEIGFWTDKIWAQEYKTGALFVHAEEATYNTVAALTIYDLTILGDAYTLSVGNTKLLSGPLRNYSSSGLLAYNTANFIFLGDDTKEAKATLKLSYVAETSYDLDPRQVTTIDDSLAPSAQPVTLRQAILNNASFANNLPITFDLALNPNPTITLVAALVIPANTQILPADCTPTNKVTLKAIVSNVLQLGGNNYLRGLEILTPLGPAIKINSPATGNKFECVRVKIG